MKKEKCDCQICKTTTLMTENAGHGNETRDLFLKNFNSQSTPDP